MSAPIRSISNPSIQRVRAVAAGRDPEVLLLEGDRLVDDAVRVGLKIELLLVAADRDERAAQLREAGQKPRLVEHFLMDRVTRVKHSPGILALARVPESREVGALDMTPDAAGRAPLVVVVAGIADPVNLGALARSAEAAGARALVPIIGTGVSPWNPRAMRGSMGSLLRLPVHAGQGMAGTARILRDQGFQQVRPITRGGIHYQEFDWSPPTALWIGSETGSQDDMPKEQAEVSIPMQGAVDSLNVTVASALILFATGRAEPQD